jgi:hypothetical protein
VPRLEAALVHHVARRMGLDAQAPVRPTHAAAAVDAFATRTLRGTTPTPPHPPASRQRWLRTAKPQREGKGRSRAARLTHVLLPLGVMLLIGGSVWRLRGGLHARETPRLAASLPRDNRLPATPEPLLPSARTPAVEGEPMGGARPSHLTVPGVRETRERRASLAAEVEQAAAPSQPAPSLATPETLDLRTTEAPFTLRAHRDASVTARATLQRPPPPFETTRPVKTLRVPRHASAQPLTQREVEAAPRLSARADPATHETSDALEPPQVTRQAPSSQGAMARNAAARSPGATETRFRGAASDAPVTPPPALSPLPPIEVSEPPAALPRSPAPLGAEALQPPAPLPPPAAVMTRSVPAPSIQGRTVEIHTGLAQTSVWINGAYRGPAPVVLHLPLGVYTIAIERPGSTPIQWKMQVDPTGVALLMTKAGGGAWPPGYMPRVFAH